jgi:hypothetical protein
VVPLTEGEFLTPYGLGLIEFGKIVKTGDKTDPCSFEEKKGALSGTWTRDLCLTKATLYQAELPRQMSSNIQHEYRGSLRYLCISCKV